MSRSYLYYNNCIFYGVCIGIYHIQEPCLSDLIRMNSNGVRQSQLKKEITE